MTRNILFISHEASRTGAPIALLHFLRWFKAEIGWPFNILLRRGGELLPEFADLAPILVAESGAFWHTSPIRKVMRESGLGAAGERLHRWNINRQLASSYDLIYCNCIDSAPVLRVIRGSHTPVICHVHELEFAFQFVGPIEVGQMISKTSRFIACSRAVEQNLIGNQNVAADRIDLIHESIPVSVADTLPSREQCGVELRRRLGVPDGTLLVGGSGMLGWRKGTDVFVQVARQILRARPSLPVHFVWLGGENGFPNAGAILHDVRLMGMSASFTHIASQPDPMRFFKAFDVFALTSREDPYPLVCLESAACGTPIVCFEAAGGMPEFVEDDCGAVVPYLDIHSMAEAILRLLDDQSLRLRFGENAHAKVLARHDIPVVGPKVFDVIRRTVEE